jgi:hypothetical protein
MPPKIEPPDFASYDELAQWWTTHRACVCCGDPAPEDQARYDCTKHTQVAKTFHMGITEYTDWANSYHPRPDPPAPLPLECAMCGSDCPTNDYLCEGCRS